MTELETHETPAEGTTKPDASPAEAPAAVSALPPEELDRLTTDIVATEAALAADAWATPGAGWAPSDDESVSDVVVRDTDEAVEEHAVDVPA